MFVADVPSDHAAPGAKRSKGRPARTRRATAGRISGLTDPRAQRAWELAIILQVLDPSLPPNTAAKRVIILRAWPKPVAGAWLRLATAFPVLECWQRQVADHCRGERKPAHDRLVSDMRRMALDPLVRRGFEIERDRLIEDGLAAQMFVIPPTA